MTVVTGGIKVIDVPDDACITTVRDLVLQLEKYLAVEFEDEKITNVIVSTNEPDTTSRDVLWFRLDNSGNFIGLYVFVQGQWLQMFPPPQAIIRMYGRSDDIPPGYQLISEDTPGLTAEAAAAIIEGWHETEAESGLYDVFDVVYVGL